MGRLFSRDVLGVAEPRVGLLSIGEEEVKGSELVVSAHALLRDTPGFVGNVEGRDISAAVVDVVVTDGFTGNVVLKTMEGVASFLLGEVRDAVAEIVPHTIVCREDCAGLCAVCGADLNSAPCDCAPSATDARWDALRGLAERMGREE